MQRNETDKSKLGEIEVSNKELAEASNCIKDLCILYCGYNRQFRS